MLNNIVALLGDGGGAANSYESIATVTVGAGGSSSISFTSIPSTYKHLQIRWLSGDNRSGANDSPIYIQFNSDTSNNYADHQLGGDGSSAYSYASTSQPKTWLYGGGATAFGAGITDILDYTSTNKAKTIRFLGGNDANGAGQIRLVSGLWFATPAAISTITLTPFTANFRQYSSFALYGVKG